MNGFNVKDHNAHVFQPRHVFHRIVAESGDHFIIELFGSTVHGFHVVQHHFRSIFITLLFLPFCSGSQELAAAAGCGAASHTLLFQNDDFCAGTARFNACG